MKMYVLTNTQRLPISREEAWHFLSDPSQLENITSDDMAMKPMNDLPNHMYEGMVIRYHIQPFPKLQMEWVTEITHIQKGVYFIDEQRFGPFRFWHHQHCITEAEGGIELEDTVHYIMPFSIIGRLIHRLFVRKRLETIFLFRQKQLEAYFGKIEG